MLSYHTLKFWYSRFMKLLFNYEKQKRKKTQRIRMAPIDSRLYKPERSTVIHYVPKGR